MTVKTQLMGHLSVEYFSKNDPQAGHWFGSKNDGQNSGANPIYKLDL